MFLLFNSVNSVLGMNAKILWLGTMPSSVVGVGDGDVWMTWLGYRSVKKKEIRLHRLILITLLLWSQCSNIKSVSLFPTRFDFSFCDKCPPILDSFRFWIAQFSVACEFRPNCALKVVQVGVFRESCVERVTHGDARIKVEFWTFELLQCLIDQFLN